MPLPQLFLTSAELLYHPSLQPWQDSHTETTVSLSAAPGAAATLLSPHWSMPASSFCFSLRLPLYWGQDLQWKNIVYFPPMLSWWVWNVCLGNILWGVWKNNRAVNTMQERPRLASLFQMWSRHTISAAPAKAWAATRYTATAVALPGHQLGSHCLS